MIAGSPGLVPFTSGRPSRHHYNTVTMWADHFSRFLYAHCQEDAMIKSTLESKVAFESFTKWYNICIKHIHSNNGVFATRVFKEHVDASDQNQSFCGVGTHWQNGIVECFIGVIMTRARTMLFHTMAMWPDVTATVEVGSFAFMHAVCLQNCTLRPKEMVLPHTLSTSSIKLYNLAPSVLLENGKNSVIKVFMLTTRLIMPATSFLSTTQRCDWFLYNTMPLMMNPSTQFRSRCQS